MDALTLTYFATRYANAWCSQNAASVAAFFEENGSLQINGDAPACGRDAITASAQSFLTAFPDMVVSLDRAYLLEPAAGGDAIFEWTLTGTNTGPGGSGNRVTISGFERWTFGPNGLVADSKGSSMRPTIYVSCSSPKTLNSAPASRCGRAYSP